MALSATTVWEIRQAGADTNGGGYKTGSTGTDWTQQNAAQYALTAIATAGVGAVFLTASAAADMVGNIAHVVSGTNFTAGFYEILSVVAGVSVTCDANVCTGVGASGVINIGGALASIGKIGSASANQGAVAGNLLCVKNDGAYSIGATETFSPSGTAASPIRIVGYSSTRPTATTHGDGYQGRNTSSDQKLIATNMPNYQYQSPFRFSGSGFLIIESINFSIAGAGFSGAVMSPGTDSVATRCIFTNPSTNTLAQGIATNSRSLVLDNDVFMTGASGGATGGAITGVGGVNAMTRIIANRIQMSQSTSTGPATTVQGGCIYIGNTVIGNGGLIGFFNPSTTSTMFAMWNTIVGFVDGINFITGTTGLSALIDNAITDNSSNAINCVDAGAAVYNAYNRLRGVTTITNGTNFTNASSQGNVTTSGAAYSDYSNQSGGDFRLVTASPAVGAAIPASASMGSLQRPQAGSSAGQVSSASAS